MLINIGIKFKFYKISHNLYNSLIQNLLHIIMYLHILG